MAKLNDLQGATIGNWEVLYRNGSTANKAVIWRCRCRLCGKESDVVGYSLTSGKSTKCRSCVPRITLSKPHRKDRIYHIYTAMKQRCSNPKNDRYDNYGGRGITVCEEWKNNPDAFIEWAFANGYNDKMSIERIDFNKGYSPQNCKWIPIEEQAKNRSCNLSILYCGKLYTLSDACRIANINKESVRSYKRRNDCSYQEAFEHFL